MRVIAFKSDDGFSLVEVLVVLSLIGLISGMMLMMMGQFRQILAADRSLSERAVMQKTTDHIARLIEAAETLPLATEAGAQAHFLKADGRSIQFLAVARQGAFTSGLMEIRFLLEGENNDRLTQEVSHRRLNRDLAAPKKIELLNDVDGLTFSFLDGEADGYDELKWLPDWSTVGKLPRAVMVTLTKTGQLGRVEQASSIAILAR